MTKLAIVLFIVVGSCVSANAREGILITVPDGDWKHWSGTCTGDWGWTREGILFSVGTRRYLTKDREWHSSADQYDISRFDDLEAEVVAMLQRSNGRLMRADNTKTKSGSALLVLEFEVKSSREAAQKTRALLAFLEVPDHKSAVEIHCSFSEEQAALGRKVFSDALQSLSEEKLPNQSLEPTPKSVTDRADARSAPAMGVAQH